MTDIMNDPNSNRKSNNNMNNDDDSLNDDYDDDDDDDGDGKGIKRNKSRRELPGGAVATLKAWLLSPEHFTHPYPTPQDQAMLMSKTGIDKKQLKNWFTNARRRIWKPMLKKQIESGKLTTSATATMTMPSGGMQVVQVPGGATLYHHHPGFTLANGTNTSAAAAVASAAANLDNPHSVQAMRVHYQQAMHEQQQNQQQQQQNQQQQVAVSLDAYGNPVYAVPVPAPSSGGAGGDPAASSATTIQYYTITSSDLQQQHQHQHGQQSILIPNNASTATTPDGLTHFSSVICGGQPQNQNQQQQPQQQLMSKADSHAVLMELFARDQDLVRQATESARLKAESKQLQQQQQQQQQQLQQQLPGGQQQSQQQQPSQMYVSNQQYNNNNSMKSMSSFLSSSNQPSSSQQLQNVPSLNSWPHFSSITSLNNLGNIPGVKSIASLSGVDLASKGSGATSSGFMNKIGSNSLANVKSMESMMMGKNDSYAFLEVFFCDRSSNNLLGMSGGSGGAGGTAGTGASGANGNNSSSGGGGTGSANQKGLKDNSNNEDNEIGLSLEDESPLHPIKKEYGAYMNSGSSSFASSMGGLQHHQQPSSSQQQLNHPTESNNSSSNNNISSDSGGTLKRAYDDAMAARGLMSVSRSCEKLTDLVLPEKMQRTLSQEFINKSQQQQQQAMYTSSSSATYASSQPYNPASGDASSQYPGQQPIEPSGGDGGASNTAKAVDSGSTSGGSRTTGTVIHGSNIHKNMNASVKVPASTVCEVCQKSNVNTQVWPCGHLFHEECLNSSIRNKNTYTTSSSTAPICPIDGMPIRSAVLAIPDASSGSSTNTTTPTAAMNNQGLSPSSLKATAAVAPSVSSGENQET